MKYKFIIMTKRSEKIAGHLDLDEIKKLMKKYKEGLSIKWVF